MAKPEPAIQVSQPAGKIRENETQGSGDGMTPARGDEDVDAGAVYIQLTERQTEVLRLVAAGLTYKEAGARLGLSPRTIKYHMAEIMQQLHLKNRAQVLAHAGKIGM